MKNQKNTQSKNTIYFDQEEKELAEYIENTDLKPLSGGVKDEMITGLSDAMKNTLAKRKTVNLRLSERDLMNFKIRAAEEGMPYQTLMASVLHKHISTPKASERV